MLFHPTETGILGLRFGVRVSRLRIQGKGFRLQASKIRFGVWVLKVYRTCDEGSWVTLLPPPIPPL